ncbi:MAG: amidohydrolase family protein [Luteitalea sp.]|nr:amidohydrolase family protein [Luteitalea sp.]
MRIWDLHCHLSAVEGDTPGERIDTLLRYADRMGIERICVFMGTQWKHDPLPEDFRHQNDEVLTAIRGREDRAFGFVYLNPKYLQESLAELDRCVRDGPMVGVKLWVAQRCNTPAVEAIFARAGDLKAVVYQHTWLKIGGAPAYSGGGNLPGESTPQELAEVAIRHPNVRLICGHTGGDWEPGIRAIRACPHVSAGIGGSHPTRGIVEMAVRELGAERVIYGSDAGGRSYASQLAKVIGADISEPEKTLILGGNLQRLLRPILKQKGISL